MKNDHRFLLLCRKNSQLCGMQDTHRILIRCGRVRMLVISLFFMAITITITITCVACSSLLAPFTEAPFNEAAVFPFPLPFPIWEIYLWITYICTYYSSIVPMCNRKDSFVKWRFAAQIDKYRWEVTFECMPRMAIWLWLLVIVVCCKLTVAVNHSRKPGWRQLPLAVWRV